MSISRKVPHGLAMVVVALLWTAVACSDDDVDPATAADGRVAPASASMRWEQSFPESTEPAHVIRRYTAPMSPGTVRKFYLDEMDRRGWKLKPGGDLSYAEWSRGGMEILLQFEPPSEDGSEWSVALFAAK